MSEYQCYEFIALDAALSGKQMDELRAVSTRADITSTRFWNEYHWGDLKADPVKLMARYFDAHAYFANWGTRRLMLRMPAASRRCASGGSVDAGSSTDGSEHTIRSVELATPRKKRATIPKIDRDKLRTKLRRLGDEYVFYMLDDALDILTDAQLAEFVGQYIRLEDLAPDDGSGAAKRSLRDAVAAFDAACRRGEYYVSFAVNSKNYMDTSSGTRSFISDCRRLFTRALAESAKGDPAEVQFAFDTLTALLRRIDEGHDDIVFFADEGGSWQVGVEWKKVFPAWFTCVARTAEPEEFARGVVDAVNQFDVHAREQHLAAARKVANPEQRRALAGRAARGRRAR